MTSDGGDIRGVANPWDERLLRLRRLASRFPPGALAVALAAGLVIGGLVGRITAPAPEVDAGRQLEELVLPLAIDADSIWTSTIDDRPPVAEALVALRRDDDAEVVINSHADWLAAYDSILVQLAGMDLPANARPVQRQVIAAVTLSRDAVEVLGHAARVPSPVARRDLTTEVGRLRQRSEQMIQSARASVADLQGTRADVAPLAPVITMQEGRR